MKTFGRIGGSCWESTRSIEPKPKADQQELFDETICAGQAFSSSPFVFDVSVPEEICQCIAARDLTEGCLIVLTGSANTYVFKGGDPGVSENYALLSPGW